MNSILNWINNTLILIFVVVSFFHHNYDYGWDIYFYKEFTLFLPLFISLIWLFKTYSRWRKLKLLTAEKGYKISSGGFKKSLFKETLPFYCYLFLIIILLLYISQTVLFSIVLIIIILEGLLFLRWGRKSFKMIITPKTIIILHHLQYFIFWDKVKSISFQYKGVLISLSSKKQIYIAENDFVDFKEWKKDIEKQAVLKEIYIHN